MSTELLFARLSQLGNCTLTRYSLVRSSPMTGEPSDVYFVLSPEGPADEELILCLKSDQLTCELLKLEKG